ncbi:hypothetical protein Taro_007733 [Colocasia esculenta]|uniref:Uncharacterized protein n=1 Tax=Colocasia esculenta TaxID=4460 RepID=A0A843U4U3_COLES|nr:hypothetical protein [Colocasia esculenta]
MSKPQPWFPCHNRTPKHHRCLNTLHQTLGDEFTSCWGRVEEFLVAGEQEIANTKPFFFSISSAATCTNRPLEVDQRKYTKVTQTNVGKHYLSEAFILSRSYFSKSTSTSVESHNDLL